MKSTISIINNQLKGGQQSGYLNICYNACIDFQGKIRRSGIKSFSVWKYLEDCFKENWRSTYRKPPRANTILHWFEDDPVTGMKMGAEDLALICLYVNDHSPLVAYYEEMLARFENLKLEPSIDHKTKIEIKDSALELANSSGNLCGEIKSALADGKFLPNEKRDVKKAVGLLKQHITKIEGFIK